MRLTASDGHAFDAYVAEPRAPAQRGVIIIQEIFGVNAHIRSVADDYASQGFCAIAPALFDRVEPHLELGYTPEVANHGMQVSSRVGLETALKDVEAALNYAAQRFGRRRTGVVGYCLGGTLAWLAATRLAPAAAVGYYGGRIARHAAETPTCPVLLHFGQQDAHIPPSEIEKIQQAHPELALHLYDAGHGINCDQRESYEPTSAALARQRTLDFLRRQLA
jgi:carboxymethylenebutenolidase